VRKKGRKIKIKIRERDERVLLIFFRQIERKKERKKEIETGTR